MCYFKLKQCFFVKKCIVFKGFQLSKLVCINLVIQKKLQTRLIEEIQDSYEKLESSSSNIESKIDDYDKTINDLSMEILNINQKLLILAEKYSQLKIDSEKIKMEIIQLLYDKGLFDSYPNKDQVFETYLIFTDEYLLNKYGKEIHISEDVYYLSDLNYEISRENIIKGLIKQEKLDMVDIKYRMKLTDSEISRIINEQRKIIPKS